MERPMAFLPASVPEIVITRVHMRVTLIFTALMLSAGKMPMPQQRP